MIERGLVLVLSCLGMAQALFLSFYLFTLKKGNKNANTFLAFVLLGLTIRIAKSVLNYYMFLDPLYRNLGLSGIFISGPFLLFYGAVLLQKNKVFSKLNYLHLLPFLIFVLCSGIIPEMKDYESYLSYGLVVLHLGVYLILCWRFIFVIRNRANKDLVRWYRTIVIGVCCIWCFYFSNFIGFIPFYIGGAIFYSFLIYGFSYILLKRHVFSLEKYRNSSIDIDASKRLLSHIKDVFENEQIFMETNISLAKVAEKLSINSRELSQVINENEQMNFSEFVNHFRIKRAKLLLASSEYKNEKMTTIAYDCGFGNVTSFNLAFKLETKMTPSAYKKQVNLI